MKTQCGNECNNVCSFIENGTVKGAVEYHDDIWANQLPWKHPRRSVKPRCHRALHIYCIEGSSAILSAAVTVADRIGDAAVTMLTEATNNGMSHKQAREGLNKIEMLRKYRDDVNATRSDRSVNYSVRSRRAFQLERDYESIEIEANEIWREYVCESFHRTVYQAVAPRY